MSISQTLLMMPFPVTLPAYVKSGRKNVTKGILSNPRQSHTCCLSCDKPLKLRLSELFFLTIEQFTISKGLNIKCARVCVCAGLLSFVLFAQVFLHL